MTGEPPIDELKALAHPLRFKILDALRAGERNVGDIEDATGIGQPALSQQLAVLRTAGLVETRKEAKLVYYKLAKAKMIQIADAVSSLSGQREPAAPVRRPAPGAANFARLT